MKDQIKKDIQSAIMQLQQDGTIPAALVVEIQVDRTRDLSHGDYACNIAMTLAKTAGTRPRDLAEKIVAALPADPAIAKTDIAGPGFINFFLTDAVKFAVVNTILEQGDNYGKSDIGEGKRIQVEFVSANPTGPLHVGHGRGAAYGAALANLLSAAGYSVHREYYVNDAGRQMNILAASVWLRYLELCGEAVDFPVNGYRGDYVYDIASNVHRDHSEKFRVAPMLIFDGLPADATPDGLGDKEAHIDGVIDRARELLGNSGFKVMLNAAVDAILDDIKRDLHEFGVEYDEWFSERSLMETGAVNDAVAALREAGQTYDRNGNLWFKSSEFGDEKDRVLVRENGSPTYFASDVAYHVNKMNRGFDHVINIWGADHHGYVARVKACLKALNFDPEKLEILLVQFAILYRGKERVQMSTRSGEFVTLRQLREDVGSDAARFFYVMRKCEQHMDFDLELAKSQTKDNPVFYIQYAHARVCNVMRKLEENNLVYDQSLGLKNVSRLVESEEQALITALSRYPEIIESAAQNHEPHQIAHYLRDLVNEFHNYYERHKFIIDDETVRNARLTLISAARQVIRNGLSILGVSAPESM